MPIARRSSVRSKSRSPAPPLTPNIGTPRPFLPPSHYAAAGGYDTHAIASRSVDRRGETLRLEQSDNGVRSKHFKNIKSAAAHTTSPSESSFISALEEPFAFRQAATSHANGNGEGSRPGFPDLEAQLLPSLRDTIDRMTRVPSRASTPYKQTDSPMRGNRVARNSPDINGTPNVRVERRSKSPLYITPSNDEEATTPIVSRGYHNQVTPTIGNISSRLKTPSKSALKSSLKSPKPGSQKPPAPDPASNLSSTSGPSLRSVKNLIDKKYSGSLKSPVCTPKENRDPGLLPDSMKTKRAITEQGESRIIDQELSYNSHASSSVKKSGQSSIPRPRNRFYHDDPNCVQINMGESLDHEQKYDREKRKLTVANGGAPGSRTDGDAESRRRYEMELGHGSEGYRIPADVGLGLSLRKHSPTRADRNAIFSRNQIDESRPVTQEKNLRFSIPPSESASSSYSDEFQSYPSEPRRQTGGTDSKQSLQRNGKHYSGNYQAYQSRNDAPSQYRRSSSRSPISNNGSMEEDYESEREGHFRRRSRSKEKRRSSSCTAAFSGDGNEGSLPIIPRRPRSVGQRERSPSPTSEPFSPSLKELIRNRNSSQSDGRHKAHSPIPASHQRSRDYEMRSDDYTEIVQATSNYARNKEEFLHNTYVENTEAAAIAQGYRSMAARERMAFGIPPSESDQELSREGLDQLSHAESDMSSLNASMWQDDSEDLSESAENILKAINGSRREDVQKSQQRVHVSTPRLSIISPTLSASSSRDDQKSDKNQHLVERNTLAATAHNTFPRSHDSSPGDSSKIREGVIQQIFETEENLLRLFHICTRTFILPLRVRNSKSWIEGVPANVARLLDWFDDIVNLHEQIYHSLCSARDTMSPATDRVSESLRNFVLKVEIYQPYLVRLSDVSEEIALHMDDPKSDFGQFVIVQQKSPECEGWSLGKLLMLPVHRLSAYQEYFARMLDLTPKSHQDYLSTFSLSRSTDMVIRIMTEVKIREDEYNLLKTFSSRIQGLSSSGGLATRERRLLHSGPLALVLSHASEEDTGGLSKFKSGFSAKESKRSSRSSRLMDAVSSNGSNSILETASLKSTSSGSSSGPRATSPPAKSSWFSRLPLRKRRQSKSPLPSQHEEPVKCQDNFHSAAVSLSQCVSVHAFVFNDVVLLAQPCQSTGDEPRWTLLKDLGIFKPLSIARIDDRGPQGIILSLEVLDVDYRSLNDSPDFRTTSLRNVDLFLAPPTLGVSSEEGDLGKNETFQQWLVAIRRCSLATLRKLTFLGQEGSDVDVLSSGSDRIIDTRLAISSLVGSGLPIPRSPSGRFPDMHKAGEGACWGNEREERGWWSLRYQQVFREFQRRDSLISDDDDVI